MSDVLEATIEDAIGHGSFLLTAALGYGVLPLHAELRRYFCMSSFNSSVFLLVPAISILFYFSASIANARIGVKTREVSSNAT